MEYSTYTTMTQSDLANTTIMSFLLGAGIVIWLVLIVLAVLLVIALWRIFTKAGEKGWKAIVPVLNLITEYKISGMSPYFLLIYIGFFIPFVNFFAGIAMFVITIIQIVKLGEAFGKSTGFKVGMVLLSPIFFLILGLGNSTYQGIPQDTNEQ